LANQTVDRVCTMFKRLLRVWSRWKAGIQMPYGWSWCLLCRWSFSERIAQCHQLYRRPLRRKLAHELGTTICLIILLFRMFIAYVAFKFHRWTTYFDYDITLKEFMRTRHRYPPEFFL